MQDQFAVDDAARSGTVHHHVLRPAQASDERALLVAAYESWRSVWSDTFAELVGLRRLSSDEFVRQHELVTLFEGARCVGLTGSRYLDFDSPIVRDDSYFASWPEEALEAVRARGRHVCPIGNFMVVPDHRGRQLGTSTSELLAMLSLYRFACSDADVALVVARNDRGVNRMMYKYGAICVAKNAQLHGVSVDLVCFPRRELASRLAQPDVMQAIDPLLSATGGTRERAS